MSLGQERIKFHPIVNETIAKHTEELLNLPDPPRGIFATSDIQAVEVVKTAGRMGWRIPEDLAVLGFDNIDLAGHMEISTIDQCLDESGRAGMELLMQRIKEPERPLQTIDIRLSVIERGTT